MGVRGLAVTVGVSGGRELAVTIGVSRGLAEFFSG